jgi:hypothetical protein
VAIDSRLAKTRREVEGEIAALESSRRRHAGETNEGVRLAALRAGLSFEDRALLSLRVDRQLGFREIAYFLRGTELDPSSAAREAARLRKRFQLLESQLRRIAFDRS